MDRENTLMLAQAITAKNISLSYDNNTIYGALDIYQNNEEKLNEFTSLIASSVTNELGLIRNKLIPLMDSYKKIVEEKIAEINKDNPMSKYKVLEISMPTILTELDNKGKIAPRRDYQELPVSTLSIPVPSEEDIVKYVSLDNAMLDEYLKEVTAAYTAGDYVNLWSRMFLNVSNGNDYIANLPYKAYENISDVIVLYAMAENLRKEKPAGVSLGDDKYNSTMDDLRSEIINFMAIALETHKVYSKTKKLVHKITDPFTVVVNADVYKEFLADESNSVEILLGLLISNTNIDFENSTMDNILANKELYLRAWDNKIKMHQMIAVNDQSDKMKMVYSITLKQLFDLIPEDLKSVIVIDISTADELLNKYLNDTKPSEILEHEVIIKKLFGLILVPHTNFHMFTETMTEYIKLNNKLTLKEAASFASLDLVLSYLLQQLNLTGITNG